MQGRSINITWSQFEICNADTRIAFENMCRMLFNNFFFDGKGLFHSDPNNPGTETVPVLHEKTGKRISFQAKYFSSVDYTQILHSAEAVVKYYSGKLDILYLYCNKNLTTSSESYQKIEKLLLNHGISLVPINNEAILEQVLSNDIVAWYYFDHSVLSKSWFEEKFKLSLSSLGPRYNHEFNVKTRAEHLFDIFMENADAVVQINGVKKRLIDSLEQKKKRYPNCRSATQKLIDTIVSLEDITQDNIKSCLSWPETLEENCKSELHEITELLSKAKAAYADEIEKDTHKSLSHLLEEINDLTYISNAPDNISLGLHRSSLLTSKILIVKGNAGSGKSQLFANAVEKLLADNQYAILLLGSNYPNDTVITSQIPQQLILDIGFDTFLLKLEAIGIETGKTVCLLIDAINESPYKTIWQSGLNSIFEQIQKFEHIKIAISVRTGYETLVFSESILAKIADMSIATIVHEGFQEDSIVAISTFLNHYGIPFSPSYFLHSELTNPLFLTLFCKYYSGENFDLFRLFDQLIKRADEEAQKAIGFPASIPLVKHLVNEIANIRLSNGTFLISQSELLELSFWEKYGLSMQKIPFIAALERSGLLLSTIFEKNESYYLGYNLLEDFVCAKLILENCPESTQVLSYLQNDLLEIEDGAVKSYSNIDIFIVVCSLYAEKYHEECFNPIANCITADTYTYDDIIRRYVESFLWRNTSSVDAESFIKFINEHHVSSDIVFPVFIENSTKENHPLNATLLHHILMNKTIAHRDYLWTTYINGLSYDEERIFQLIEHFDSGKTLSGLSSANTELLLILFTWLLTSSNRILRDKASKASIELLKKDFSLCKPLLQKFENVNDPYVIQRLYGIVFGACTKRNNRDYATYRELAEYVYNQVFNRKNVYPDILLRDYARLILELWIYEAPEDSSFINIAKICPPYSSTEIPIVEKQEYYHEPPGHSGFNSIYFSMNINHPDTPGMYGDFGRYTFQSALSSFENVDIVNLYHYAMQFIRDDLGYSDELFGNYDSMRRGYSRHDSKKTERIGKKYQWIAFYNILARVSDHHQIKDSWSEQRTPYKGSWEPYVRDFDPTLNNYFLKSNELPEFNFSALHNEFLPVSPFPSEESILAWTIAPSDFFGTLSSKLIINSTDASEWVYLDYLEKEENDICKVDHSVMGFAAGAQILWLRAHAYFVNPDTAETIRNMKNYNFFKHDIPHIPEVYQLFNREYPWAPGYQCIFSNNWVEHEIESTQMITVHETIEIPDIHEDEKGNIVIECIEKEIENQVPADTISIQVMPSSSYVLWEEEYDASQDKATAFDVPCKSVLEYFKLKQNTFDGYFYDHNGILVCFDAKLAGIGNGLIMRKDYLEKYLSETGLELFWACYGEKQFFANSGQEWRCWNGLFFFENGQTHGTIEPQIS